ncbi:peptidoglycan recognition protein family protein [Streptomyces sp. NPDC001515]
MKLITRAQLGWPASAAPSQPTTNGVKIHYEGTAVSTRLAVDHTLCVEQWKNIRASHLANEAENYSDVAYNYAACPHGYLLEGRGLGKRTGANGNQALNRAHYAIVGLVGSSGLTEPTDAMLSAIRDGIDLLRKNGAGNEIKGHRDGYATACPGGPLYAWVQKGAPRPATSTSEEDNPMAGYSKNEIGDAVLYRDHIEAPADDPNVKTNKFWSLASYVRSIYNAANTVRREQRETAAKVDKLTAAMAELTALVKKGA